MRELRKEGMKTVYLYHCYATSRMWQFTGIVEMDEKLTLARYWTMKVNLAKDRLKDCDVSEVAVKSLSFLHTIEKEVEDVTP